VSLTGPAFQLVELEGEHAVDRPAWPVCVDLRVGDVQRRPSAANHRIGDAETSTAETTSEVRTVFHALIGRADARGGAPLPSDQSAIEQVTSRALANPQGPIVACRSADWPGNAKNFSTLLSFGTLTSSGGCSGH